MLSENAKSILEILETGNTTVLVDVHGNKVIHHKESTRELTVDDACRQQKNAAFLSMEKDIIVGLQKRVYELLESGSPESLALLTDALKVHVALVEHYEELF